MTPTVFLFVKLGLGAIAGLVAIVLGLLKPPLPHFVPRGPGQGGELAPPLIVGAFAAYCVTVLIAWGAGVATGMSALGGNDGKAPPLEVVAQTMVLTYLLSVPAVAWIAWYARQLVHQPFEQSPTKIPGVVWSGVCWSVLLLPMVIAAGSFATALSVWMGQPVDTLAHSMLKRIVEDGDPLWRWSLIACAVIGAPIAEEFCFRALLQRGLMTYMRASWPAVLVTSVVFTLLHAHAIPAGSFWPAATAIFTLSVGLGLVFARTGSVVTPIVVHALFNAVSIALAVWQR